MPLTPRMELSFNGGCSTPPRVRRNISDGKASFDAHCCQTPVRAHRVRDKSPEPPAAPGGRKMDTPLLKAIRLGNIAEVAAILKRDPELARDRVVEPAICCAVRHQTLSKEMLQLLLQHGAEVDAVSYAGDSCLLTLCSSLPKKLTPLDGFGGFFSEDLKIDKGMSWEYLGAFMNDLSELPPPPPPMQSYTGTLQPDSFLFPIPAMDGKFQEQVHKQTIAVATMLLASGAKPQETIKGYPPQLAKKAGHESLATLLECYEASQAYFVLCKCKESKRSSASTCKESKRSSASSEPICRLGKGLIGQILSFLVSEENESTMSKIALLEEARSSS